MKTKNIKQLLVALSLLLAVPAFAQDMIVVHMSTAPEADMAYLDLRNPVDYSSYRLEDSVEINYNPGQTLNLLLYASTVDNWAFTGWTDANGALVSMNQYDAQVSITAPGHYYYYANYRFSPRVPGYLPMGSYDLSTGTLTIYRTEGSDMMQNYYALASRYKLQSQGKYHDMPDAGANNLNPINMIVIQGVVEDSYQVIDLVYNSGTKGLDLSQLSSPMQSIESYMFNWMDSLRTVILPDSIFYIYDNAFSYLPALHDVYLYSTQVPMVTGTPFNECCTMYGDDQVLTIHVPAQSLTAYQADSIWSQYNIVAMALNTTANIAIYPQLYEKGMYLTLSEVGGTATMTMPLQPNQTRYDFMNLQKGRSYMAGLYSALGFLMDSAVVNLSADTALYMTNAAMLSGLNARIFVDTAEVTDQCLISWLNTSGDQVFATGDRSPMMPQGYNGKVYITPLNELAVYLEPKDTFVIYQPGHNGLWVQLEKKPVGGQDTARVETGTVWVSVVGDVSNTICMLYDGEGNMLGKASLEQLPTGGIVGMNGMPVGCYSAVIMREGQYSTLSRLDLYSQMGLTAGTDYLLNEFCIAADSTTHVTFTAIPAEPQITNFLGQNARFYANKSEVMVAGQLTLTAEVDFLDEYVADISNLFYVIDLPENVQLVENSVLIGSNAVSYSLQNGQLRVGAGLANLANVNATTLRFCVIPMAEGEFYPSASVEFNYRNQAKAQPISNTFFTAKAITLQAPNYTVQKGFTATGFAPANATVNILSAENTTLGTGTANALGKYTIHCTFEAEASRTFVVHAEASTSIISGLMSDTCSVFYDGNAAAPTEIQMTHYNQWYHRNMNIIWNLQNCTTNESYYYYYLDADFTFRVHFVGQTDSVYFVAIGQDGSRTQIPAYAGTAGDWWAIKNIRTYKVPVRVDVVYKLNGEMVTYENCKSVSAIADPSGYVYEAVSSNRLEGVTAAAYMKESEEDMPVLWDATPYDQVNPMLTDAAGGYAWDVPKALWQVRFSKTGYQPAQTKWLPVPPPQMEVNMPLVRLSEPEVWAINAYEDNLTIEFDRYMMPEDLTDELIHVGDGTNRIAGQLQILNSEPRFKGDSIYYASKVKFVPTNNFETNNLTVEFGPVRSYAGVPMTPKSENTSVTAEIKNFGGLDTLRLFVNQNVQRTFYALPQVASAGKTMTLSNVGDIFSVNATTATVAANGGAMFTFTGLMPGTTELRVGIDGTDLEAFVTVIVTDPQIITSVQIVEEDLQPQSEQLSAEKFIRDNMLLIRLNGNCYTVTGVRVE